MHFGNKPQTRKRMWPLETRKVEEIDFPLEPPERQLACQYPDFRTPDLQKYKAEMFVPFYNKLSLIIAAK